MPVVEELLPAAVHGTTQYANNGIECDHGRLEAWLRPMRGLRTARAASTVIRGHAFVQNLRRAHYELGVEACHERLRLAAAFDELTSAIRPDVRHDDGRPRESIDQPNSSPVACGAASWCRVPSGRRPGLGREEVDRGRDVTHYDAGRFGSGVLMVPGVGRTLNCTSNRGGVMQVSRSITAGVAATFLVVACGQDRPGADGRIASNGETETTLQKDDQTREASAPATAAVAAAVPAAPQPSATLKLEQPAVWPGADVVFTTPDEAATDFVTNVLAVSPILGEFQAGDSRSGEIEVFSPGDDEDPDTRFARGTLALRQLGPDNGWFVLGGTSEGVTITTPEALSDVAAGTVTVAGEARGFEGTVVISAFPAGNVAARFDVVIGRGGAMADTEPYSVELDMSGAVIGEFVALLAQADTGLGGDPGEFAVIPVVAAGALPPTR